MVCSLIDGPKLAIRQGSETQFIHERVKTPNASPPVNELNPRCSGQAHFKRPRTGSGNENIEYECVFGIHCAPSIICPLSRADAYVACRASHFIELPCQTSFCPVFIYFFVSLLSAAQHLTPAVVCNSSFYKVYSCIIIVCV